MIAWIHPGNAILVGILIVGTLTWLFWPKTGVLSVLSRARMSTRRMLLEDALKYLFNCEYKNVDSTIHSLAGKLNVSVDKAAKLLDHLRLMELISMTEKGFQLTETGRSYALRIIRVHRIWERYLADETGIKQADWHGEADFQEHQITMEAADALAAQMGNPAYDPHGDPIPLASGELPSYKGRPLSGLHEGELGRIIHIEDEPRFIYEQLIALGLYPGMEVYILDDKDGKITFAANGEECVLTPLFASGITVELLPKKDLSMTGKYELLSSLRVGEEARVAGISPNCGGQQRRRLMDLGIVPGATISAELKSASGDPVGYRVMGTTIAIRKDQASLIFINKKKN